MLSDFLTSLTRKVEYKYKDENNKSQVKIFEVKGLSLLGLANIFNNEKHGRLLLKFVENIDLDNTEEDQIKKNAFNLIDTNYSSLVYHFIASCIYIKDEESNEMINCANQYELMDSFPISLITKLLYTSLELTLPEKEYEVKSEIKKLMALLTK